MATILFVQCNRLVSGVQYPGISSLVAFAKKAGHEFILFDTANYTSDQNLESYRIYKEYKSSIDLEFKRIKNTDLRYSKKPLTTLLPDLEDQILTQKIDVVGFSSFSDDWPFALFLIRKVRTMLPDVPIVVGGVHATVAPEQVIRHREVDIVCIGEGEYALVELLDSIDKGRLKLDIKNLWIKNENEIIRNPLRPLLQFNDEVPILDWTLYNDNNFYYPYEGKIYRRGSVFVGRNCPYSCSFCINNYLKSIYPIKESGHSRTKSISYLIREIAYLKEQYNLEMLRFWDETFLAVPFNYLKEFAEAYKKEIGLPFTIETTAQTIKHENAKILAEMGCKSVSIGVETSNEKLRAGILNKPIRNEAYNRCFEILSEYGLRKVANFMFFLPEQSVDDMWNDVNSCKEWGIDHPSARIFYPYAGTSLREYCIEKNMVDTDMLREIENEESVRDITDLKSNYATFQDTVLKVTPETKKEGMMILDNFILFQESELSMRDHLKQLVIKNDDFSKELLREIESKIYEKRFGKEA